MKAALITTLFCSLFLECASANKTRLFAQPNEEQHAELAEEENAKDTSKAVDIFLAGRSSVTTECDSPSGANRHHSLPCDDNVESNGDNSKSISTRNDPEARAPESCLSDNGVYGKVEGVGVPISYQYEMQTFSSTDSTKVNSQILPKLEKMIVDSILPHIFPEKCASTSIGKRSLNDGELEAIGVSMNPLDYVTTLSCNFLTPEDSTKECFVLKGELTIYFDEDQIDEEDQRIVEVQESIRQRIKENMNEGNYDNAHEDITELLYLDKLDPSESNVSTGEEGDGQVQNGRRNLRMGLFVGIGTLTAVLVGVVFRLSRRMRNTDDQTDMQTTGVTQTYLDVEEQSPSFS